MEEIENAANILREEGAEAFRKDELVVITEIKNRIEEIKAFRERIRDLQKEWKKLLTGVTAESIKKAPQKGSVAQRLGRGLRTPEDYFRLPILKSLVQLGGSAPMRDVLESVYKIMENQLNEYNYQGLPSTGQAIWENTAQWCRNSMVAEGFLAADSPRGTWTISKDGEKYLIESRMRT